jgi:hypothetical protein
MLHQCTKLPYVTNVELIVMSDPGVLHLKRSHPGIMDLLPEAIQASWTSTCKEFMLIDYLTLFHMLVYF